MYHKNKKHTHPTATTTTTHTGVCHNLRKEETGRKKENTSAKTVKLLLKAWSQDYAMTTLSSQIINYPLLYPLSDNQLSTTLSSFR